MTEDKNTISLVHIEPHTKLLKQLPKEQPLYKIMSVENFIRSIKNDSLHFNRVDSYKNFPGADLNDGKQLKLDQKRNEQVKFEKNPSVSLKNYFDKSRARTYGFCLSLENSNYIWRNYGGGDKKGKIAIIFDSANLRKTLNKIMSNCTLSCNGFPCPQVFSINHGLVEYIEWNSHQLIREHFPNPIQYTYIKDQCYSAEKEFRVSLSAIAMGNFALKDGSPVGFPTCLKVGFNFKAAIQDGTIIKILLSPDCNENEINNNLRDLGITRN